MFPRLQLRQTGGWRIQTVFFGFGVRPWSLGRVLTLASVLVICLAESPRAATRVLSMSSPVLWLDQSTADKRQRWSLRVQGLRGEVLRLLAPRCRLALVSDPGQDFLVGVGVEGFATCREVVQVVISAQPLPDPITRSGGCPSGAMCEE